MNTGNLEQYKKLIRFAFNIILLICLMGIFIHVWDMNYNDGIVFPFYYRGYLLVGAFYAFFFVIFSYILGGMKIGYLKSSSLLLSQTIALFATNVCIYLETVLLSARFVTVIPMIKLTVLDIVIIVLWTFVVNRVFRKLFPPHSIILLYEEYDPTPLLKKVNSRRDRYIIKKSMV